MSERLNRTQHERQRHHPDDRRSKEPREECRPIEKSMAEGSHGCESVKCNDRASWRCMRVHVNAHRPVQTSPGTQLLVIKATLAVAIATMSSGQDALQMQPAGGAGVRCCAGVVSVLPIKSGSPTRRHDAGVAKLADAQDLKSWVLKGTCGFDPRPRHCFRSVFSMLGCVLARGPGFGTVSGSFTQRRGSI